MEKQRSIVPAVCIAALLAFGGLVVHRSRAAAPDPLNDQRRALVEQCAQRNIAPYATWCVPDGWTLEAPPPSGEGRNIDSTARDNHDPGGARLHLNGPAGQVAQLQVANLPHTPAHVAEQLDDSAPGAMRQSAIADLIAANDTPGGFTPDAGGTFLPEGTVPHGEVYATRRSDRIVEWLVFRGAQRISIMGMPGWIDDGTFAGQLSAFDIGLIEPAVQRILATWAWADDWAEAPGLDELGKKDD